MTPLKLSTKVQKEEVIQHLLSFDLSDRRLRFGYIPSEYAISEYVNKSWARKSDTWFGIYDVDHEGLVATLHIAKLEKDSCEFAFTVAENKRNRGIGDILFKRGVTWAKARGIKRVYIQCLSENKAMQKIARNNSMDVNVLSYDEAEANMDIPYDPTAVIADTILNGMAIYDMIFINRQKVFFKMIGNQYDRESV